ncbi:MAG: hypothetical protein ACJAY2_003842 [Pseudomonadales bacterium]
MISEIPEVFSPSDGSFGHKAQRLTGIPTLAKRYLFSAGFNPISDVQQDFFAFPGWYIPPNWKSLCGSLSCGINVRLRASSDLTYTTLINRRKILESLARHCRNNLPVDMV